MVTQRLEVLRIVQRAACRRRRDVVDDLGERPQPVLGTDSTERLAREDRPPHPLPTRGAVEVTGHPLREAPVVAAHLGSLGQRRARRTVAVLLACEPDTTAPAHTRATARHRPPLDVRIFLTRVPYVRGQGKAPPPVLSSLRPETCAGGASAWLGGDDPVEVPPELEPRGDAVLATREAREAYPTGLLRHLAAERVGVGPLSHGCAPLRPPAAPTPRG